MSVHAIKIRKLRTYAECDNIVKFSPSDQHLFPKLKQNLGGNNFKDGGKFGKSSGGMARNKAHGFDQLEIMQLIRRYEEFLANVRECVENYWNGTTFKCKQLFSYLLTCV